MCKRFLQNYRYVPYNTFFKIFEAKTMSVMLYGSELMGLNNNVCIENIHFLGCKRFLKVHHSACNDVVLVDLGRYLMYAYSSKRCI